MFLLLRTSYGPVSPFFLDYLDTPSTLLYFLSSAHLLPLRIRLTVIVDCAAMPFVKA
jgi:hypothetical protein